MGVAGLSERLKEVASKRVRLDGKGGEKHVIVDGHYALHFAAANPAVAIPLVKGDVLPLAWAVGERLNKLASAGWDITVVFDGRTPPGKAATARSRTSDREAAMARCTAYMQRGVTEDNADLRKAARDAVHFTSVVVARVSRVLVHLLRCTCIRAAYESDGQLAFLEDLYLKMGRNVVVLGNDSDLMTLGVRTLLWEFAEEGSGLFGEVFTNEAITRPQLHILEGTGSGSEFLRLLHGIQHADDVRGDHVWWNADSTLVMERLRLWSCVAGNDYSKFAGIGPAKATDLCLRGRGGELPALDELVADICAKDGRSASEVEATLRRSKTMTLHPVVYCMDTGRQLHLSRCASTPHITLETGSLAEPELAQKIARGAVCPCTLQPWGPFPEALESLPQLTSRQLPTRKRRAPVPRDTNNFERTGFSRLPTAAQIQDMTVLQLRELLSPIRCLEKAGISAMRRPELQEVAVRFVEVIQQCGLVGSATAFRTPRQYARHGAFSQPSDGWHGWESLREYLPEFAGDAIIIAWLRARGSLRGETGRVLYRGLQRVMDLGALGGLRGIPSGEDGGILHLRFTTPASFRETEYLVQADLRVESVDERPDAGLPTDHEHHDDVAKRRLVATAVIAAWCQCKSGEAGGCHHVSQLLQLARLLELSENELEMWDPDSPTSAACKWILQHCGAKRGTESDIFRHATGNEVAVALRQVRDPKRVPLGVGDPEVANTRGVVAMDRRNEFSSHPDHGVWADTHRHFQEGSTLSRRQWDLLSVFVDGERGEDKRGDTSIALDVLPPRLRPDSPSHDMVSIMGEG